MPHFCPSILANMCQSIVYLGLVCLCVAQLSMERAQPVLFLSAHSCKDGGEKVAELVVGDSGMCKASFCW